MPPASSPRGESRLKGGRKALVVFTVLLGLGLASLVFGSQKGLYQIYRLKQERVQLQAENARLAEENERLSRTIDRLQHDPEMIQDLIRRELNFVRKNEIIIQLRNGEPQAQPAAPPEAAPPGKTGRPLPVARESKGPGAAKRTP